jgi:hypothetical protein
VPTIQRKPEKSIDFTESDSHVESYNAAMVTDNQSDILSQTWDQSENGDQSDYDQVPGTGSLSNQHGSYSSKKKKTAKKSSKSIRTTKSGLSSDIYRITSSDTLPVSNFTKSKTRLSSSLSNLSFNPSFGQTTYNTDFDRHSDTDLIKIKVDHVDSSESDIDWPITIPSFPKFSPGSSHFLAHSSAYNSATPWRVKSSKTSGSNCTCKSRSRQFDWFFEYLFLVNFQGKYLHIFCE